MSEVSGRSPDRWAGFISGRVGQRVLAGVILALALLLRSLNLDWDDGHGFHPDERAMAFAVERISIFEGRFDPEFFAYGSLPIYAVAIARDLLTAIGVERPDFDGLVLLGRALSALAGALTVAALFLFAYRRWGWREATTGALLLASSPLHIQNSRYFTVDVALALLSFLALSQAASLAESGGLRRAVRAGIFTGLACGTKLAGASLLLPLLVACWSRAGKSKPSNALRLFAGALSAAVGAFLLSEPMAVTRPAAVLAGLTEQAGLVRNAGSVPYTLQYVGTRAIVYPAEQLLVWGAGLGFATALLAAAVWFVRRPQRFSPGAVVLVSWLLPFVAFFAVLDVKFPRYLLPALPVLALGAGRALVAMTQRHPALGRAMLLVAVFANLANAAAYVPVFGSTHTAVAASRWFYETVPDGSRVLVPDWDEGFPLSIAGLHGTKSFESIGGAFYDRPDDAQKLMKLCAQLEAADYVVFPTRRIYGSIWRAREELPLTAGLMANLFDANLGFELLRTFESRPRLLGFEIPDELADESLTVYDHPRVLIFKKTEQLPAAELFARAFHLPDPAWTLSDLLRASPGDRPQTSSRRPLIGMLVLIGVLEVLTLCAFVWITPHWRKAGAFSAARVLGPFGFAYLAWLGEAIGWVRFDRQGISTILICVLLGTVWRWRKSGRGLPPRREVLPSAGLFYTFLGLFLLLRAMQPAIYWGEKPMDFGFLSQLMRATSLPPADPWFAGAPLSYSYFGHLVAAVLGKLSGLEAGYLFNLAVAVFAALAGVAAFAAGLLLTGSRRAGLLTVALVTLLGNLSGVTTLARVGRIGFDYFWATSRVIPDTINEYPFWTYVFADLHAHALAIPLVILFAALASGQEPTPDWRAAAARGLGSGWLLGLIAVTSSWSSLSMGLLLAVACCGAWLWARPVTHSARPVPFWTAVLLPLAVAPLSAWAFFAPHWRSFRAPEGNFGLHDGPVATAGEVGWIFGLLLLILLPLWTPLGLRGGGSTGAIEGGPRKFIPTFGLVLAVAVAVASSARWGLVLLLVTAALGLAGKVPRREWVGAHLLALTGVTLVTAAEFFFVWDRMNTVFKYYLDAWILLSIAASIVLARVEWRWRPGETRDRPSRILQAWRATLGIGFALALWTSLSAAAGALREPKPERSALTLDGVAYLERSDPAEAEAFRWLNRVVEGSPTVLEAHGPAYGPFGRVSMHTGLPTPLGWDYHVFQRGHAWTEIHLRKSWIETVYRSDERSEVCTALRLANAGLLFVGSLERSTYGAEGEARLSGWTDLVTPVFRNDAVTIFRVLPTVAECATTAGPPVPLPIAKSATPSSLDLLEPRGIAAVPGGYWVCDFGHHRLVRLGLDLRAEAALGRQGRRAGEFEQPCAVAVSLGGELLVADTWNHRIQRLDPDGSVRAVWEHGLFGPRGLAVDPASGEVLVADTGNSRIVRLSADGELLGAWGEQGSAPGQFWEPTAVAIASDGRVAVADSSNERVQILDREGRWQAVWDVPGWRREVYSEPNLQFLDSGDLWFTVPLEGEVRAFDRGGELVALWRIDSPAKGERLRPVGLTLSPGREEWVVTTIEGEIVRIPAERNLERKLDVGEAR